MCKRMTVAAVAGAVRWLGDDYDMGFRVAGDRFGISVGALFALSQVLPNRSLLGLVQLSGVVVVQGGLAQTRTCLKIWLCFVPVRSVSRPVVARLRSRPGRGSREARGESGRRRPH